MDARNTSGKMMNEQQQPVKKRRLNTLLEPAVIVSSETLRMNAAANKQNPANVLLHSSPETDSSAAHWGLRNQKHQTPSPSTSDSSTECVKPFSLPLPSRSTPSGTPPTRMSTSSAIEVPPAPYRATITGSKLPPNYNQGRKLEWTSEGHPVEPSSTTRVQFNGSVDGHALSSFSDRQQRSKTARRVGVHVLDCPDACLSLLPASPFQDGVQSRRTSNNYTFSSEESLRRKTVSPRKSAPQEP